MNNCLFKSSRIKKGAKKRYANNWVANYYRIIEKADDWDEIWYKVDGRHCVATEVDKHHQREKMEMQKGASHCGNSDCAGKEWRAAIE